MSPFVTFAAYMYRECVLVVTYAIRHLTETHEGSFAECNLVFTIHTTSSACDSPKPLAVGLFDFVLTGYSAVIYLFILFPVTFRPDCKSWPSVTEFHDLTQTHHTRYGCSGRRITSPHRPLPDNTQQTSMPLKGFEPAIPESSRRQTHAVDRAATGIGIR